MGRKRTGTAYEKGGVVYVALRLADDTRWARPCAEVTTTPPGVTVTVPYARSIARSLQARYDAGTWHPKPKLRPLPPAAKLTVGAWCTAWADEQTYESASEDRGALKRYLAPAPLAGVALSVLTPAHALDWIARLVSLGSERGGTLAPRTVRNVYDAARRALDEAVLRGHLAVNALAQARKRLPGVEDKHPEARADWCFTTAQTATLVRTRTIRGDRRVLNALRLLGGLRTGEACALRWRDWDDTARPLGRITVARAIKSRSRKVGATKTGAVKHVPVHPELEAILTAWRAAWTAFYGRAPTPEDLIVPVRGKALAHYRDESALNRAFKADCKRLGLPVLHQHVTRHTWITLAQDAGGDPAVLRWITHAPPRTAFDGYTRAQWSRLCAEVSKLALPMATDTATEVPPMNESTAKRAAEWREHTGIEAGGDAATAALPRGFCEPGAGDEAASPDMATGTATGRSRGEVYADATVLGLALAWGEL